MLRDKLRVFVSRISQPLTKFGNASVFITRFVTRLYASSYIFLSTPFCFYKNVVFSAQGEYSDFSADFRLKIVL